MNLTFFLKRERARDEETLNPEQKKQLEKDGYWSDYADDESMIVMNTAELTIPAPLVFTVDMLLTLNECSGDGDLGYMLRALFAQQWLLAYPDSTNEASKNTNWQVFQKANEQIVKLLIGKAQKTLSALEEDGFVPCGDTHPLVMHPSGFDTYKALMTKPVLRPMMTDISEFFLTAGYRHLTQKN